MPFLYGLRKIIRLYRQIYRKRSSRLLEVIYGWQARHSWRKGVTRIERQTPVIVSVTTIPERIDKVHLCIESILRQSLKPDKILLYINEADKEKIPLILQRQQKRGLCLKFCRDIGPYKKIIYSLKEYPESLIVTADDDMLYPPYWLKKLYCAYKNEPMYIHCWRAHLMTKRPDGKLAPYKDWLIEAEGVQGPSHILFATDLCGVLYSPQSLSPEVLNEKVFMDICPTNEDIWLKAMSLLNGTQVKKVEVDSKHFPLIEGTQQKRLFDSNVTLGHNDPQIEAVFSRYNLWPIIDKASNVK